MRMRAGGAAGGLQCSMGVTAVGSPGVYEGLRVRIKLSDPAQLRSLVLFLAFDQNVLVTTVSDREIEVGFVGSLNVWAQQRETELRLRAWMESHPGAIAVLSE
jgi:hypothetical protein